MFSLDRLPDSENVFSLLPSWGMKEPTCASSVQGEVEAFCLDLLPENFPYDTWSLVFARFMPSAKMSTPRPAPS